MYVIASFEHSNFLELAITDLEQKGIEQNRICAIPLNKMLKERMLFDNLHRSDGQTMFDLPTILATCLSLFGVMWGFLWTWGPIIWGLIFLLGGFFLGFCIKYFLYRNSLSKRSKYNTEVVVIINCKPDEVHTVETVLLNHMAIGIGSKK